MLTYDSQDYDSFYTSNLYRSTDYGATYTDITATLPAGAQVRKWVIDPYNSTGRMYLFDAVRSVIYVSSDTGATFTAFTTPFYPSTVVFHPTDPNFLLAADTRNSSGFSFSYAKLYLTRDAGKTWTLIHSTVTNFKFGNPNFGDSDGTIYIQTYGNI